VTISDALTLEVARSAIRSRL